MNSSKKICVWFVLFFYTVSSAFAGGYIKKGATFKAEEDVRYFTYSETVELYKEKQQFKNMQERLVLLKDIVADQEEVIKQYKLAADMDAAAIKEYKQAAEKYTTAIEEYKQSNAQLELGLQETRKESKIYQEVVTTQTQALKNAITTIGHQKSKNRFERNLYFVLGVAVTVGAVELAKDLK